MQMYVFGVRWSILHFELTMALGILIPFGPRITKLKIRG